MLPCQQVCPADKAVREWLWTFVDTRGIEPTNNTAERALRPAVIYRKLSFGTQSELVGLRLRLRRAGHTVPGL